MKWIGQQIYDQVSKFRNDVYLEDISTSTETSMLVVDSSGKISKRAMDALDIDVSDFMTNGVDNRVLTATGADAMNAEANLTFDGSTLSLTGAFSMTGDTATFTSSNADDPAVIIENTAVDNQAARLQFKKHRGVDAVDGDNIGEIEFWGYDDGTPSVQRYGGIFCEIHDATSGQESGFMALTVASHDGGINAGLKMYGGNVDNEVDVEIGRGAASITDIQGTLKMGGTLAMTNAGLLSVANQSGITGLGTISSGTWQGTAIASAYLDSDTAHLSGTQTFSGAKTFSDDLTVNGTTSFTNAGNARPVVEIKNTGNNTSGGAFQFVLDKGAVGADNDIPGGIQWISDNDVAETQEQITFGQLYTMVSDATDGQEAGTMFFKVAEFDGTLTTGLKIDGNTDANGEIDVTIGAGAASVTKVVGTLTMGSTAAMDNAGLLTVGAQTGITAAANLVTVGTIGTGVWNATKIAEDKVTQSQIVNLKGYLTLAANYFYAEDHEDAQSPFELAKDYGSATISSSTEVSQSSLFRAVGFHVPFACVLDSIQVQASINNNAGSAGGTMTVAVVEYRPSELAADQNDYPRTVFHEVEIDATDNNNKIKTANVSSPNNTAIPAGSHLLLMVKGDSDVVGDKAHISVAMKITY